MRFPRMTTRRWMVVVAVVALTMAVYEWRRASLLAMARHHWEMVVANSVASRMGDRILYAPGPSLRQCQLAAYHVELAIKYSRAARYPWRRVEPDPPEPE